MLIDYYIYIIVKYLLMELAIAAAWLMALIVK